MTSADKLLKKVLEFGPEGSLEDLSVIVSMKNTERIGDGRLSTVYKGQVQIKGKGVNVAIKHLRFIESEEFVVKVSISLKTPRIGLYAMTDFRFTAICKRTACWGSTQTSECVDLSWVCVAGWPVLYIVGVYGKRVFAGMGG